MLSNESMRSGNRTRYSCMMSCSQNLSTVLSPCPPMVEANSICMAWICNNEDHCNFNDICMVINWKRREEIMPLKMLAKACYKITVNYVVQATKQLPGLLL